MAKNLQRKAAKKSDHFNQDSLLKPQLVGFKELFIDPDDEPWGLRRGSSILVSGTPGAGKTTFALSLLRSLVGQAPVKTKYGAVSGREQGNKPDPLQIDLMYYISVESEKDRLKDAYREMGWFGDGDLFQEYENLEAAKRGVAHILTPPVELDRPVRSSEDNANYVVSEIARLPLSPDECQNIAVVVDSVSALLRDCTTPGEERRQTYELMHRLRDTCGYIIDKDDHDKSRRRLALMIFIAEESSEGSSGIEEYLTDYVFHLSSKATAAGRRLRTLQVKKSQGSNMIVGEHTWAIMTGSNYREIVQEDIVADEILNQGNRDNYDERLQKLRKSINSIISKPKKKRPSAAVSRPKWGTVAIFPRPRLQNSAYLERYSTREKKVARFCQTGTSGLDEILTDHKGRAKTGGLVKGSVTLLLGPSGVGITTLCFQFLAGGRLRQDYLDSYRPERNSALLINFSPLNRWTFNQWKDRDCEQWKKNQKGKFKNWRDPLGQILTYHRSQLDLNLALAEITAFIRTHQPERIAIDGLSERPVANQSESITHLLETLISVIRGVTDGLSASGASSKTANGDYTPTIFIGCDINSEIATNDPGTIDTAPGEVTAAMLQNISADNIIRLDKLNRSQLGGFIENEKVIQVIKTAGQTNDPTIRWVKFDESVVSVGGFYIDRGELGEDQGALAAPRKQKQNKKQKRTI